MQKKNIPINKGNYSMDTPEREAAFETKRGVGWQQEYAEYRSDWSELPKKQIVRDYPLLVDIELSSLCNLRCPMCYTISDEFKRYVNTTRMDWDLYVKIIDEIAGKVPAIRLSLRGEALLHRNFVDCIKYAKDKGIKEVSTLTHGGKLDLKFFQKISDAGIDWITISIDGVWDTYEKIRKPLKFERLLKNITEIHKYKMEKNLVRPVIKVQGIWPAVNEDADQYYNTFAPIVDLVAYNPLIDYLANDSDIAYVEGFSCPQQYQRLVIGADGIVMKCSNDEENREPIGDLNKQSVHEVWHGPEMTRVREIHKKHNGFKDSAVCRKCYLPRETQDEKAIVCGRELNVPNYVNRSQVIGS